MLEITTVTKKKRALFTRKGRLRQNILCSEIQHVEVGVKRASLECQQPRSTESLAVLEDFSTPCVGGSVGTYPLPGGVELLGMVDSRIFLSH